MLSLGLPMENEVFVLRSSTTENGRHLVSEENIVNGKKNIIHKPIFPAIDFCLFALADLSG